MKVHIVIRQEEHDGYIEKCSRQYFKQKSIANNLRVRKMNMQGALKNIILTD